jgi:hypothetical protein
MNKLKKLFLTESLIELARTHCNKEALGECCDKTESGCDGKTK